MQSRMMAGTIAKSGEKYPTLFHILDRASKPLLVEKDIPTRHCL